MSILCTETTNKKIAKSRLSCYYLWFGSKSKEKKEKMALLYIDLFPSLSLSLWFCHSISAVSDPRQTFEKIRWYRRWNVVHKQQKFLKNCPNCNNCWSQTFRLKENNWLIDWLIFNGMQTPLRLRDAKNKGNCVHCVVAALILMYWCTTWTLAKSIEEKLDGNYTGMLRAILNRL